MDDPITFAIDRAVSMGGSKWKVDGRAYLDVRVGDTLNIHGKEETAHRPFVVTAISAYGREIPELSRGLTGSLIIEGENGDLLKDASALIRSN